MKIRVDEHISPRIVRAIQNAVLKNGWTLTHVREVHGTRTADETWIPKFAQEGGRAIITADARILKRPHQILAFQQSNIIGIFLASGWAEARRHFQAANLLYHWPEIEKVIEDAQPGTCWKVPASFGSEKPSMIKVNYAKAATSNSKI